MKLQRNSYRANIKFCIQFCSFKENPLKLSKENNVILMVGHILLFHPAFNKIKEIIDSGLIGKIQYMYSNRLNLGKVRTHENVFWSLAPHDIAIFQYLTDSIPIKINAKDGRNVKKVAIAAQIIAPKRGDPRPKMSLYQPTIKPT